MSHPTKLSQDRNQRSRGRILFVFSLLILFHATVTVGAAPDLVVKLGVPKQVEPGQSFKLRIKAANLGGRTVYGTASNKRGYMIDLFMTRGRKPTGYATYKDSYFDGVLLKGGRISNTVDLLPGKGHVYTTEVSAPDNTSSGSYELCARIDPADNIRESKENNNLSCRSVSVVDVRERLRIIDMKDLKPKPVISERPPPQPREQHSVSEKSYTVLPDGTLEITLSDGTRKRRDPNGEITTIFPNGVMGKQSMIQVQKDELPPLPSHLHGWGEQINDSLLGIIRNLLETDEFSAYRQTETGKGFYEIMDWRVRSIDFLTRAQ